MKSSTESRCWPKYCASCRELLVPLLQGEAIQPSLRPHTPRSASTMGILTPHRFFFCNCHLWKFGYAHMGATRSWIIWLAAHHYRGGRYLRFERRKYGSDQSWFKGSTSTECWTQRQATSVRCRALASFHALHIWYQRVEPYMFMSFILVPMSIYS